MFPEPTHSRTQELGSLSAPLSPSAHILTVFTLEEQASWGNPGRSRDVPHSCCLLFCQTVSHFRVIKHRDKLMRMESQVRACLWIPAPTSCVKLMRYSTSLGLIFSSTSGSTICLTQKPQHHKDSQLTVNKSLKSVVQVSQIRQSLSPVKLWIQ